MENATIFGVYGTLKNGGSNHELLEHPNVEYMGRDSTRPEYTMIDLGAFPAIVPLGTTHIYLEVYRTDDKWILERINQLEGFKGEDNPSNLYDFVPIKTQEFNGVHVYQMKLNHPWVERRKGVVPNGNWPVPKKEEQARLKFNAPQPMQVKAVAVNPLWGARKDKQKPNINDIIRHNNDVQEIIIADKKRLMADPLWNVLAAHEREQALQAIDNAHKDKFLAI